MSEQTSDHDDGDVMLTNLLRRSATDREFRSRLIAEPERAVEEFLGVPAESFQQTLRMKFVEKDPEFDALVVLPDFEETEGELSDAELEAVAGGDWCITSCTLSIATCFITSRCEEGFCGSGGGSSW